MLPFYDNVIIFSLFCFPSLKKGKIKNKKKMKGNDLLLRES